MIKSALTIVLFLLIMLSTSHLWQGDIWFHTDVARDHLVLSEMIRTKKPTLIGPRSGGIEGVFHGPLWFYMELPAFLFVGGNPVGMGWFWWILTIEVLGFFFLLIKKMSNDLTLALSATLLLAAQLLTRVSYLFNPFGAVFLSPFFFWFCVRFLRQSTLQSAILLWLTLGMMIQFQMAFAGPIFLLALPLFLWKVIKTRSWNLLLSLPVFLLTISTFVLFDFRHDFLQLRSAVAYLSSPSHAEHGFFTRTLSHAQSIFLHGTTLFLQHSPLTLIVIFFAVLVGWSSSDSESPVSTKLFVYFTVGYFAISLLYKAELWEYYILPFVPLTICWLSLVARKKSVLKVALIIFALFNAIIAAGKLRYTEQNFNVSSWKLLHTIARDTFQQSPSFGYFVYSQDQLAYGLKYAFLYTQSQEEHTGYAFQKKPITFLIKSPDDPHNPYLTATSWQTEKVRLFIPPSTTKTYPFGYSVEKYQLTLPDMKVESDQNLVKGIEFR